MKKTSECIVSRFYLVILLGTTSDVEISAEGTLGPPLILEIEFSSTFDSSGSGSDDAFFCFFAGVSSICYIYEADSIQTKVKGLTLLLRDRFLDCRGFSPSSNTSDGKF